MNYSAAARRGRARRGGRPGPRVPRRCEAAAATSQTFPGRHRGCGPRGASVPARARRPRFPRCRLFYVFCLGVGTCPRERVSLPTPSPPDRGGGGGTGDPERRGRGGGGKQGAYGPRSQERPPEDGGRARAPGRLCFAGRSRLRLCPEYQRSLRGPPDRARCGRGRAAAPPRLASAPPRRAPSSRGQRARAGRAARAADSPPEPRASPAAPRARPRGHATPGAPPPRAPGPRPRPPAGAARGTAPLGPHPPPASRPGAARLRGRAGAIPGPCSPGRPGTEEAAGARSAAAFQGAGCHDCGQRGARAGSGPARRPRADRRSLACAQTRARRGQRLGSLARYCRGQRVPRSSRRGPGTELGVGGGGLPSGQGAHQGDPAAALRTAPVRQREGRGARCGGGRGARDLVKWRGAAHRAQRWRGCARCLAEGGCPQGAGKAWDGGGTVPRAAAQLRALCLPSPQKQLPAPLAQSVRRSCGEKF